MQLIKKNPYRTVGLLVGATAKEQSKQINKLKMYLDAEQDPQEDFSFPTLGKMIRTVDIVTDAAAKLHLNSDKMNAALFWFYSGNSITDEPALDALKDDDIDQAVTIWSKLTSSSEVTQRNASAHNNLATLYLCQNTNENIFEKGISLKLKFLESDFIKDFKTLATDEFDKTSKKELQLIFLNQIQSEIEKKGGIGSAKFLKILLKQTFSAKQEFLKGFVQKPIEEIEKQIEETRKKQKANPAKAGEFGNELNKATKPLLTSIISILGKSDIKVISISDKLANEILQCSINLFNHFHETGTEVGEIALDLNNKAKSIALGSVVRERINESTPIVERYINNRAEREKQKLVQSHLKALVDIIQIYENKSGTIENAKSLINQSIPKLNKIKSILGGYDDLYLKLSTRVAAITQHNVIEQVNDAQKNAHIWGNLSQLRSTLQDAWAVIDLMGKLDMEHDFKTNRYIPTKSTLKDLCNNVGVDITPLETLLKRELSLANSEMETIKEWQFLRSESDKQSQINAQQRKIDTINQKIRNL